MKKILSSALVALVIASPALAQEYPDFNETKNSLEIGFNPFANNFNTFRIDGADIKYRRFFGQNALRARIGFGIDNQKWKTINNTETSPAQNLLTPTLGGYSQTRNSETETTTKSTNIDIYIGYERHFDIGSRFDLYAGAEIGLELQNGSRKDETSTTDNSENLIYYYATPADGYSRTSNATRETETRETKKNSSSTAFGANIFTGVDVTVWKGLYLGAELGLGLKSTSYKTPETTVDFSSSATSTTQTYDRWATPQSTSTTTVTNIKRTMNADGLQTTTTVATTDGVVTTNTIDTSKAYNATKDQTRFSLKLYVNPSIRIGWRF